MIYLIGGPARVGKSTLAEKVRREIDGHVLSGDAFVHSLQENLQPEWLPDIFDHIAASVVAMEDPETIIDRLRRRDETMWQFYQSYIATVLQHAPADDLLLDGNLWPDYLELFDHKHRTAFLIDTSENEQVMRLKTIRDSGSDHNWMRGYDDAKVAAWAHFNALRSRRYKALCEKTGYAFFDIAELGAVEAEQQAFAHLLQEAS